MKKYNKTLLNILSNKIFDYLITNLPKAYPELNEPDVTIKIDYIKDKIVPKFIEYGNDMDNPEMKLSKVFLWDKLEIINNGKLENWYFKDSFLNNIIFNTEYHEYREYREYINDFNFAETESFVILKKYPKIAIKNILACYPKNKTFEHPNYFFELDNIFYKVSKPVFSNISCFKDVVLFGNSRYNDSGYRLILLVTNLTEVENIKKFFNKNNFMFKYVTVILEKDFLNLPLSEKMDIFQKKDITIENIKKYDFRINQLNFHPKLDYFYDNKKEVFKIMIEDIKKILLNNKLNKHNKQVSEYTPDINTKNMDYQNEIYSK